MSEIDDLTGEALSEAVALARGWKKSRDTQQFSAWFWVDDAGVEQTAVAYYRPHSDIAKAWELDGDGWLWKFVERGPYLMVGVTTGGSPRYTKYVGVDWADSPTKAQAYATARCRAFLKAKAAE